MKKIMLIRHARAQSKEDGVPDFERSLTKRGEREARSVAGKLKKENLKDSFWISSTANRALETAHIFVEELGFPVQKIMIRDEIYGSPSEKSILDAIRLVNDRFRSVVLFGHDPSISLFASRMLKDFKETIPKCGVLAIGISARTWRQTGYQNGEMLFFLVPDDDLKERQRLQNEIKDEIAEKVTAVLDKFDPEAAAKTKKKVKKMSEKISGDFLAACSSDEREPGRSRRETDCQKHVLSRPGASRSEPEHRSDQHR